MRLKGEPPVVELGLELGKARLEALPSIVTPSWEMRRSSSFSSGQAAHSSRRTTLFGPEGRDGVAVNSADIGTEQCMRFLVSQRLWYIGAFLTPPDSPGGLPGRITEE